MADNTRQRARRYLNARREHPAWLLLASQKGPVVLSCLQTLFAESHDGVEFEAALLELAEMLRSFSESGEVDSEGTDYRLEALRELRQWIKRGLVVEREGRLLATDALETALQFAAGLDRRLMTSTASRLAIVQREIENLEANLNPDPRQRADHIRRKITTLQRELEQVQKGDVKTLPEQQAMEAIREVFNLSTSLRNDFRRVEDSYREADQRLRKSIISEQNHRGDIVDKLLDSHDALLNTDEGKVFDGFQQQLVRKLELDDMKQRLRTIVQHPHTRKALNLEQQAELRWLIVRLVAESQQVIRARARSERDVKGFLKTGLAAEHHRVGNLLNQIFAAALDIDWSRHSTRNLPGPLPPVAPANSHLPLVERLRFANLTNASDEPLDLMQQHADLHQVEDDFWAAFDGLDRLALLTDTRTLLDAAGTPLTVADIATRLAPEQDLEALAFWLTIALDTRLPMDRQDTEQVELASSGHRVRFTLPRVALTTQALNEADLEV